VCAYDTRALPEPVLVSAQHTHPLVLAPDTPALAEPNPRYVSPAPFLRRSGGAEPDPLESTTPTWVSDDLTDRAQVASLRHAIRSALGTVPARARSDFVAAIVEVATNGLIHGLAPVGVRTWVTPQRVLCTVTDQGQGFDDPLAGYAPVDTGDPYRAGAGLWLARQSCDSLVMASGPDGFTVRLSASVPANGARPRGVGGAQARAEAAQWRAYKARMRAEELQRRLDQLDAQLVMRQRLLQPATERQTGRREPWSV
jgi:anti-sigma regulatory factor (Ser/Thr protein kinase)